MSTRQTKNVMEFLKIRRGGESFWVRVLGRNDDGTTNVKCDSHTSDPEAPAYGAEFMLPFDEQVFDQQWGAPRLQVVE